MTEIIFVQLSVVLGLTLLMALVMKALRQPLLIGYMLTGVIVGPSVLGIVHGGDAIDSFGQIGVAFLLFIVGLGLRPKLIRDVGSVSVIIGVAQIIGTSIIGYLLAQWLGYSFASAIYLGIAFTLSSTIVVLQLLYTKEEQDTLHGRLAIGFLLVQDFAAMLMFLFLTSIDRTGNFGHTILIMAAKAGIICASVYVLTTWLMPRIELFFARSREVLFVFALTVCFVFAAGFAAMGFSQELGALLAGVLLSSSAYHRDIALRLYPLRDFFLMMFFVVLGAQVTPAGLVDSWPLILAFTLFIIVGNPLIVMALLRPMGYALSTSFFAGLTVAQVSEFSLILLATGVTLGHISSALIGPATAVGLITIFISSYAIMHDHQLYRALEPFLRIIYGRDQGTDLTKVSQSIDVILFGCHRLGGGIVEALQDLDLNFLVIDHDPEIISDLNVRGIPNLFGSVEDAGLLDSLPLKNVQSIISTIPEIEVTRTLVEHVRRRNAQAIILCVSNHQTEAAELYQAGATYVIVPPYLGRRYMIDLLKHNRLNASRYHQERTAHLQELVYIRDARQ